jgi:tellurite resistance protein
MTCSPTAAAGSNCLSAAVIAATALPAPAAGAVDNNKLRALVTSAWQRRHGLSAEGKHIHECNNARF